jgi:hypothetical protein
MKAVGSTSEVIRGDTLHEICRSRLISGTSVTFDGPFDLGA